MKRKLIMLSVAMFGVVTLFAQPQHSPNGMSPAQGMEMYMNHLDNQLDLSDEQVEKIKAIYQEAFSNMPMPQGAPSNGQFPQFTEEQRKEMAERRKAIDEKIEAVLNDEQKAKYAKMREERRRSFGGQR